MSVDDDEEMPMIHPLEMEVEAHGRRRAPWVNKLCGLWSTQDRCRCPSTRQPPYVRWRILPALLVVTVAALGGFQFWVSSTSSSAAELMVVRLGWDGGREEWLRGRETRHTRRDAVLLPPDWDSASCLQRWGLPRLQTEPDPAGYIVFVNGREQLGCTRFLMSDGLFIAKTLNRTLVEFPVANARIAGADSDLGFGAYWDFDSLCRYHRILALEAFRSMIDDGRVDADGFVTMTPANKDAAPMKALRTAKDVREAFSGYKTTEVIVMKNQWKSSIRREPMTLFRPLPFYVDLARRLVDEQQGWERERYLTVQWRTETSTGNLTRCYGYVRDRIEEYRTREGFKRGQVFFNTDLPQHVSGTYSKNVAAKEEVLSMIHQDYPAATNNSVTAFLEMIEDSGVRSMASGVVAASSTVLMASTKRLFFAQHRGICQKVHSNFVDLVVEFREKLRPDGSRGTVSLFPTKYKY